MILILIYRASSGPLAGVDVHVADQVSGDGGATVVQWRFPGKLDVLGTNLLGLKVSWFERHVEDVDVARGFKSAGLACQSDRVQASVAVTVSLHSTNTYICSHMRTRYK